MLFNDCRRFCLLTRLSVQWYINVIREQTHEDLSRRPIHERNEIQEKAKETDMHWGYFWLELGHNFGPQFDAMTLAQAASVEFAALERVFGRALART